MTTMKNKLIAVLLTLVMIFSFASNVYAASIIDKTGDLIGTITDNAQTTVQSLFIITKLSASLAKKAQSVMMDFLLDSENWEKAGDAMMDMIVKVYDKILGGAGGDDETSDTETPAIPALPDISTLLSTLSIGNFVDFVSKYFFINIEDIPAAADDIIEKAEYSHVLLEDGKETVFIAVNIEEHPELLNRALLMEATEKLYNEQKVLFPGMAEETLMSYEHIAGELALHAILYAVSNEYLSVTGATEGLIFNLWQKARIANLDITEARIPGEVIQIVGTYIMGVFIIDLYTLFSTLK
ncbi:MAG: hypothetical protein IKJ63_10000 [Clostridia bacterium]|nr:hypothetical protein [Clostridia bacterium]MBR3955792.1 hypothetical protein [Clostridia bacterium]